MPEISIIGGGVAACCCAYLLSDAGCHVFAKKVGRAGSPVLLLSDQTQHLLIDVFGGDSMFDGAARITKRVVKWGQDRDALTLPHSGLVMPESTLLNRLWPQVNLQPGVCEEPRYRVISSKPALPPVASHEFGARTAHTSVVELNSEAGCESCWVESTNSGWLFLLPSGGNTGSLISVGRSTEKLLEESTLIVRQISGPVVHSGSFPAHPRIVTPLCGLGWIACGSAAIAFDPIAGEGAGNAVREGLLAAAVIKAVLKGDSEERLLNHYSGRLLRGFLRHVEECYRFYHSAGTGGWWMEEAQILREGAMWAQKEVNSNPASAFRLTGFELQSISYEADHQPSDPSFTQSKQRR